MRESVRKQNKTQKANSTNPARSGKLTPEPSRNAHPILELQRIIGNQAVLRMLRSQEQEAVRNVLQVNRTHEVASNGISGPAEPLPHLDAIQKSFGRYDVSGVEAHTDARATAANQAIDAVGYTMGNHVAFGGKPDLRTAAHEAAHIVQQRGEVQLLGGIGQAGVVYERHANAVADEVVQGRSSEDLLADYAGAVSTEVGLSSRDGIARQKKVHGIGQVIQAQSKGRSEVSTPNTLKLSNEGRAFLSDQLALNLALANASYRDMLNQIIKEEESKLKDRAAFVSTLVNVAFLFAAPWLETALYSLANLMSVLSDKAFILAIKLIDNTPAIIASARTVGSKVVEVAVASPSYKTEMEAFSASLKQYVKETLAKLFNQSKGLTDDQLAMMCARFDPEYLTDNFIYTYLKNIVARFQKQVGPIGEKYVTQANVADIPGTENKVGLVWIQPSSGKKVLALVIQHRSLRSQSSKATLEFESFVDSDLKQTAITKFQTLQAEIMTVEAKFVSGMPSIIPRSAARP